MEKNIKMSLETAREIYKIENVESCIQKWLLENFTKEELEGDEGYTWEKAFSGGGWHINNHSDIRKNEGIHANYFNKNVFKTEAQAKSALAFAQLSHICAAANEGKKMHPNCFTIENILNELTVVPRENLIPHLFFYTYQDAKTSLRVNRELWEQYHQI